MKFCNKCQCEKTLKCFTKNKTKYDGLNSHCKDCNKLYYKLNRDKIIASAKISQTRNKVQRKKYLKKYGQRWRTSNRDKNCYKAAMYRASKLDRTVSWADLDKIKQIYINCPKGYHVDHIIPLKGKNISGLHIETNLQYLPANENIRKGNR